MKRARALVVEDEADIRNLIAMHLSRNGFEVETCDNGLEAVRLIRLHEFPLVVLDWMLPGKSGLDVLKDVRKAAGPNRIGVLMVTARADPNDIVLALECGADDYLVKPFELSVLAARARTIVRRFAEEDTCLKVGSLTLVEDSHEVTDNGKRVQLTPYEFKILLALARNKGRVLTRNQLISQVQGEGVAVTGRTIDTHVFGLRKKLGDVAKQVETLRGIGYRFTEA